MRVKLMDGPKAGTVISVPETAHEIVIPRIVHDNSEIDSVDYEIHKYWKPIFRNEHVRVHAIARLGFSEGLPANIPSQDLPFEVTSEPTPEPDFLSDFDRWWRRKLWDLQITQDRATRHELQRLEYAKGLTLSRLGGNSD